MNRGRTSENEPEKNSRTFNGEEHRKNELGKNIGKINREKMGKSTEEEHGKMNRGRRLDNELGKSKGNMIQGKL